MHGYHGRYLVADASSGRSRVEPIPERVARDFLGGVGLSAWILARENPPRIDPLDPDSTLVFSLSPLVGSPLTTSAKFAVSAISPLTGRFCDALSSSSFAIAAKRAGVDAIAVRGKRESPSVLFIDGREGGEPEVRFESAAEYWGLSAAEAETRIRSTFGNRVQVAAIGVAGERLIPFATISHDGRHAGRGGLGAVLGSKRIKAVVVRGESRVSVADPEATIAAARDLSARSFGPATAKYRELGTVANLLVFNRFDALPTRNFRSGSFEGAERLLEADLDPARRLARNSCAACTIGCEHVYSIAGAGGVRLEYESLFALGPMCGIDDGAAVTRAAAACDRLGLDTISTGGTIAFLADCVERGWIDGTLERSRRILRFGDGDAILELIEDLSERRGLGELAALGSRRAAERIGGDAVLIAPHVKGLEMPGYDPRVLHAMALGLAVGTRGADHNRSSAYEADFSDKADRRLGGTRTAELAIASEDRSALMDSLILCKFLRGVFEDFAAESAELLRAVTGWDVSAAELGETARRIVNARKLINIREGWTRAEDALPPKLLAPPSPLDPTRLDSMIAAYYRGRGWTETGQVPDDLRRRLRLDDPSFD